MDSALDDQAFLAQQEELQVTSATLAQDEDVVMPSQAGVDEPELRHLREDLGDQGYECKSDDNGKVVVCLPVIEAIKADGEEDELVQDAVVMHLEEKGADEEFIILKSSDLDTFKIPKRVAKGSKFLKTTMQDKDATEISLTNVDSIMLKKIIEYLTHCADTPEAPWKKGPIISSDMTEMFSDWSAEFADQYRKEDPGAVEALSALILAANYMDIDNLLNLCSCKMATWLRGKTTEEMRVLMNITNDFTPEEETQAIADMACVETNPEVYKNDYNDLLQ